MKSKCDVKHQCPEGCWRLCGWLRRPYSGQRPHRRGAWHHHPKNIMRVNIIILNSILKHNILIGIQKHCRSTGSASWEWVRSWPPKLSQTAPSVPRLVCAICFSSLSWWSIGHHLHLDGHHLCIGSSSSWWSFVLYLMTMDTSSLPWSDSSSWPSSFWKHGLFLSYWLYWQWPKFGRREKLMRLTLLTQKKRWLSNSWDLDLRPPNFATSRGQKKC